MPFLTRTNAVNFSFFSVSIGAPKKSQETIAEALPKFYGIVFNNLIFCWWV